MTKSLTKQWRDGTLPDDTYYWKVGKENWIANNYEMYDYTKVYDVNKIKCLAPVPVYDVWKNIHEQWKVAIPQIERLKKQLDIAIKALKEYADRTNWSEGNFMCVYNGECFADEEFVTRALKEMEGVK